MKARQRVYAQQHQDRSEPPLMINVRDPQLCEPPVRVFSVLFDVDISLFPLLDHRADGGQDRQGDHQKDGELERAKEFDEGVAELLETEGLRSLRVFGHDTPFADRISPVYPTRRRLALSRRLRGL